MAGTLGAVALGAESTAMAAENGGLLLTPAVVMAPRSDGVEVVWAVARLCRGWVEWSEPGGETRRQAADDFGFVPQGDSVMRVKLRGLRAGQPHRLRVVVEAADGGKARQETPWKEFRTLDPAADTANFVVWNDTHENHETLKKLNQVTPAADFLLWNGDTCNDWHQQEWLIPTLLNPAGQDITSGRPLLLAWGNHDVRGKWAFRVSDLIATPQGRPFFAFRSGPVAVVCLHTGEDKPDKHPSFGGRVAFEPLREEQAAWLKSVTAEPSIRDAPHKVVFCHIPLRWTREPDVTRYDAGEYDHFARSSRDAWHDALVAWGAQVVISGHTHRPAWIPASEKFPYAQMVSGGPRPDSAHWIEGKAGAGGLNLVMRDLAGSVAHEVTLPRI
jgi:hypothetical protein